VLAFNPGELVDAWTMQQEALKLGELIGDPRLINVTLTNLGIVACARGEYETARDLHLRGLDMAAKVREPRAVAECLEVPSPSRDLATTNGQRTCSARPVRPGTT
jgi:hypothetical protein